MIAAFVEDLLFRSKIRAVASHTGAAVSFLKTPDDPAIAGATMAIVDLDAPDAVATVAALRSARPELRLIGFVSHVHAARIRDARAAGAAEVMARSAFVSALPDLLAGGPPAVNRPVAADIAAAAARIAGRITRTPLLHSSWLSAQTGADVWLKLENLQIEGSFKTRGAFNALLRSGIDRAVTASAGNHGRSLAMAAKASGAALTVFAPGTAPRAKLDPIRRHGATLELCDSYDEAEARALAFAADRGVPYISPYNNADVIAGAGTAGLEVLEDLPGVDVFLVPVGGGGLVSGIALAAGGVNVMGVEAAASPVFTTALAHGRLVPVTVRPTLADGLAGNAEAGAVTFDVVRDLNVRVLAADEAHIAAGMRGLLEHHQQSVEGAGAAGVAGLLAGIEGIGGRRVVVMISGGNVDAGRLPRSPQQEPRAGDEQQDPQRAPEHGRSS